MDFLHAQDVIARLSDAPRAEVESFYAECVDHGLPLADAAGRATFLWLEPEGSTADALLMRMNRISDKRNLPRGLMERVPGTELWVLTLELPPALCASYSFVPIEGDIPELTPPPEHGRYPGFLDPGNRAAPCGCDAAGSTGWSVYSGPQAPDHSAWQGAEGSPRHSVESLDFASGSRDNHLYLPPGGSGSATLVVLTDADAWFGRLGLHHALDCAIMAGQLAPVVVVGPECVSKEDRLAHLGARPEFVRDLAETVVPWAKARAAAEGVDLVPGRAVLTGQSLGGLTALLALMEAPDVFTDILAQSPSLWWNPENPHSPAGWQDRETDWITDALADYSARGAERGSRVRLTIGEQEGFGVARVALLAELLSNAGWDAALTRYDGGHDYAWWRGALLDGLGELLR